MKLSAVRKVVEGKRVVMIDDSIVRGTTSRRIVGMLKEAGAKEVHVRISSPPVRYSCFYGIDTSDRTQLIAAKHSVEEIRELIGADSLSFLSEGGLIRAVGEIPGTGRIAVIVWPVSTENIRRQSKENCHRLRRGRADE